MKAWRSGRTRSRPSSGDKDLIRYVQDIAGLSAIGKVCVEGLIIAYGEGRNGKSTFWNTLSRVLGTYSGTCPPIPDGRLQANVKPELAEVKGKRLIIAAELEKACGSTPRMSNSSAPRTRSMREKYRTVQLRAEPHARAVHEPPAEGRCSGRRHVAQADRDPFNARSKARRISRTMPITCMRRLAARSSSGS